MSDKKFWSMLNILLVLLLGLLVMVIIQWPDKKLHLVVCDVGQGDGILVKYKDKQILVDGGPDNSILSCLGKQMPFWDRKIELMVLTHGDSDHVTGLIEVLRRYQVERVMDSGVEVETSEFEEFKAMVKAEGLSLESVQQGEKLRLGMVEMEVLWPSGSAGVSQAGKSGGVNEVSVVMLGKYGKFSWLLTGDIGEREEDVLRLTDKLQQVEVLKVGHHGSKTSSSLGFLQAVKPELAVISVGKNSFGHPSWEVVERLEAAGIEILRTDEEGLVEVVSDGRRWWTK